MTDWAEIRARFPALAGTVYLNTAAGAPISRAAAAAGAGYYEATLRDGDVHWDEWLARVEEVRGQVAAFIGADTRDVAFTANASLGLNLAARMLGPEVEVLLVADDFPSVTWPWMQHGHRVRFATPGPDGGATLEALAAAATPQTRVLAVGLVQYRTGYRYDLRELGSWCRERGIALVVDATQGLGAVPVDVGPGDVDFLACSGYKWLTAGYGVGFLCVNPRWQQPHRYAAVGWRSARDPYALRAGELDVAAAAAVLEAGHPPFAGVLTLGAALETHREIGVDAAHERVRELAGAVQAGLEARSVPVLSPRDPRRGSGIVAALVPEPAEAARALAERGVLVSARGGSLRISTHFYNDEADVARLLELLPEVAGRR